MRHLTETIEYVHVIKKSLSPTFRAASVLGIATVLALGVADPTGIASAAAAPIGQPSHPFPHECRSGEQLTLGEAVHLTARALTQREPRNRGPIRAAERRLSSDLDHAAISSLLVTRRAGEVTPSEGALATHGANAVVQRVLSIKDGTYHTRYRGSTLSVNDAFETALVGLEATNAVTGDATTVLGTVVSSVTSVPLAGKAVAAILQIPGEAAEEGVRALADGAANTCLAGGDGTVAITRQAFGQAATVAVSPELTALAARLTLATTDCRPLTSLSLDEAVDSYGSFRAAFVPKAQRPAFLSQIKTIRANLRKTYVSNAFVPKDSSELVGVFANVASAPQVGGPALIYAAGVLQSLAEGGELHHHVSLASLSVDSVFNGARAVNDALITVKSVPEYALSTAQGAGRALCRAADHGLPYPNADNTIYTSDPAK